MGGKRGRDKMKGSPNADPEERRETRDRLCSSLSHLFRLHVYAHSDSIIRNIFSLGLLESRYTMRALYKATSLIQLLRPRTSRPTATAKRQSNRLNPLATPAFD